MIRGDGVHGQIAITLRPADQLASSRLNLVVEAQRWHGRSIVATHRL